MTYIIKSAIVLSALYLPYMLLLRKESFFRFNRAMLLCIMMLSLTLPLFDIHALSWESNPMSEHLPSYTQPVLVPSPHEPQADAVLATAEMGSTNWWHIISLLYIIGMAIMLATKLTQLGILYRKIRQGVLWADKQEGATIYCHATDVKPCSWMNAIVISQQDYQNNKHEILLHEKGHILHRHSLDILLLTLVQLTQWWNPFIYMLGTSLRDVHEYEADHYVLSQGVSLHEYQSLLLKTAVGSSSYAFTNSLNHSLTKKRITMMKEQKTSPWMRCKSLYILPLSLVAICAFATPEETAILTEMTSPEKVVAATPAPVPAPTMNEPEPAPVPAPTVADSKPVPAATPQPASEPDLFPKGRIWTMCCLSGTASP